MKKQTRTTRKIREEVLNQYKQKPVEDITIKDVCAALSIPRTSFYYHYDSIRAVLQEIGDEFILGLDKVYDARKIREYLRVDRVKFINMIETTKDYLYAHYDMLEAFLVIRPYSEFRQRWLEAMRPHYPKNSPYDDLKTEILVESLIVLFTYAISNHIEKERVHPEKLMSFLLPLFDNVSSIIY